MNVEKEFNTLEEFLADATTKRRAARPSRQPEVRKMIRQMGNDYAVEQAPYTPDIEHGDFEDD